MAIGAFILGESGSGKSFSLKKLDPKHVTLINIQSKFMPFKGANFTTFNTDDPYQIMDILLKSRRPVVVIDDFQYLMSNKFMRDVDIKGYDKYTQNGKNVWDILMAINHHMKPYQRVYILAHTEEVDGKTRLKTIGKLLNEKITPEGMVGIVLQTHIENGQNYFMTKNNGSTTVKTPFEMFDDDLIPNDLELVDNAICDYYQLPKNPDQQQVA